MMEDAKTSVDEQLSQIDAKLAPRSVSPTEDVQSAQVLSSDGIQDANVDSARDSHTLEPIEPSFGNEPDSTPLADAASFETGFGTPQAVPVQALSDVQALEDAGPELLELLDKAEVPDALTQVLSSFSDSWVTEMSQRVDVLKEQITVVHHKLDQFSPR